MLLDANRPELAGYWVKSGLEKRTYFDFKGIDLRSDIWSDNWRPEKWHAIYATIKNGPWPLNQLDKLSIVYFHYKSDLFKQAAKVIVEMFPELMETKFEINENNFRYAVYYSELTRKLKKYERSIMINKAIKIYLAQNKISKQQSLGKGFQHHIRESAIIPGPGASGPGSLGKNLSQHTTWSRP